MPGRRFRSASTAPRSPGSTSDHGPEHDRECRDAYHNLVFARQQYEEGLISLNLAKELYNQNVVKRNTGVLTNLDVLQARPAWPRPKANWSATSRPC